MNRRPVPRLYNSEAFRQHYGDFVTAKVNSSSKRCNVVVDNGKNSKRQLKLPQKLVFRKQTWNRCKVESRITIRIISGIKMRFYEPYVLHVVFKENRKNRFVNDNCNT